MHARILLLTLLMACGHPEANGMQITSPAFSDNGTIPVKYGCKGAGVSPPLAFGGIPPGTKSLTLHVDDPDAPGGSFTHWDVTNIPPTTTQVTEGQPPAGGTEGKNGFGKTGWGGPCPPSGTHHYVFTLTAVDGSGKTLATAKLTGTYSK
jgi:Raf kinase inhibitor-like YbhB/YbcL family protein